MASTVSVSRLALIGLGAFGRSTVESLHTLFPGSVPHRPDAVEDAFHAGADAVVLASWRPAPAVHERADELAHRTGTPWLPVTIEQPVLRVGPLVVPGDGPCFRCYRDRRIQHDANRSVTRAVEDAYDRDGSCGPAGFLPQHRRIAAGAAAMLLGGHRSPGRLLTFSLLSLVMRTDHVVACHGCGRCRPRTPPHALGELVAAAGREVAGVR